MIGTALMIASLAATAAGMAGSARANRKASLELQKRKRELENEYRYDYNMDFLNTPQAQSVISLLSRKYIENAKKAAQTGAIMGRSDEAAAAQAESIQRPYTEVVSQLAGYGQQRQDALRRQYLYSREHIGDLIYQNQLGKGQNFANLATNALGAAGSFSIADAYGAFDKQDLWLTKLLNKPPAKLGISNVKTPTLSKPINTPSLKLK